MSLSFTCSFEDHRFTAQRGPKDWSVTIHDTISGEIVSLHWTDEQIGAVMALAFGGEEGMLIKASPILYEIAEPLFKGLSFNLRIIP